MITFSAGYTSFSCYGKHFCQIYAEDWGMTSQKTVLKIVVACWYLSYYEVSHLRRKQPWKWREFVPPKHWNVIRHDVKSHKTVTLKIEAACYSETLVYVVTFQKTVIFSSTGSTSVRIRKIRLFGSGLGCNWKLYKTPTALNSRSGGKAKDFCAIHVNQLTNSAPSLQNGTVSQINSYPAKILWHVNPLPSNSCGNRRQYNCRCSETAP